MRKLMKLIFGGEPSTAPQQQGSELQNFLAEYADKLKGFNSTLKYKAEIELLELIGKFNPEDTILDYGCGIGTAIDHFRAKGIKVYGYDRFNYINHDYISDSYPLAMFNKVYFMHSIAHIDDVINKLITLKDGLQNGAEVIVITPNLNWLNEKGNKGYKPDPTVITHFDNLTLKYIFEKAEYEITLQGQFGENINGYNERLIIKAKYNES